MTSTTKIEIPQYRLSSILGIWAAAVLPMAVLAWMVAPKLATILRGPAALAGSLLVCLSLGLIWQFLLVMILLHREQGNLHWTTIQQALWLQTPRNPRNGYRGGKYWLILLPLLVAFALESEIPDLPHPVGRDLVLFISSDIGIAFFRHASGWYAVVLVLLLFNTVLGEELLFRGFLLPRMNRVFGRRDWIANGILFALYHLHTPWVIPAALLDTLILAYPTRHYRSAWIGIIVHSAQSVVIGLKILDIVLRPAA